MKAARLIQLIMLLQTRGRMTAGELSRELEVSPRTIYRDIDALSAAGIPVYTEPGVNGGCALVDNYRTSLTGLTEGETRALFIATVPSLFSGMTDHNSANSARLKLTASLPIPLQKEAQRIQQLIFIDPAGWFQWDEPTPHLPKIQEGMWQERRVRLLYRTANGSSRKRLVAPYGLVAKGGIWYTVVESNGAIVTLRVSRIQEAALTSYEFRRSEQFSLQQFWATWVESFEHSRQMFTATLRIPPAGVQPLIQLLGEGVHQLAARSGRLDRRGNLFVDLQFASLDDACRKLLGLGDVVEVVEPQLLREHMVTVAKRWIEIVEGVDQKSV